jgi:hypothetical protein
MSESIDEFGNALTEKPECNYLHALRNAGLRSPEYHIKQKPHCDICTGVVLERPVNAKLRRQVPKDVLQCPECGRLYQPTQRAKKV